MNGILWTILLSTPRLIWIWLTMPLQLIGIDIPWGIALN